MYTQFTLESLNVTTTFDPLVLNVAPAVSSRLRHKFFTTISLCFAPETVHVT
jgi:hypothetical protein